MVYTMLNVYEVYILYAVYRPTVTIATECNIGSGSSFIKLCIFCTPVLITYFKQNYHMGLLIPV